MPFLHFETTKLMNPLVQGTRLHYVERGDRSRTMILCLHDFADFWFGWRNQLLELGDRQTCERWLTMFDVIQYIIHSIYLLAPLIVESKY